MVFVLSALLWLFGLLLVVAILSIATPMRLRVSAETDPVLRSRVVVRPFGGICLPIPVYDSHRARKQRRPEKASPRKGRTEQKPKRRMNSGVLRRIPATFRRMLRAIHVDRLVIDGEFGTGDPAETGQIYGQLTPLIYVGGCDIHLRPNFEMACLRGRAEAQLSLIPVAFLWPLAGLVWHMFRPIR